MNTHQARQPLAKGDFADRMVNLAATRATAELELVRGVLTDPAGTMPVSEAAGITPESFETEDLRLIYLACDLGRARPIGVILKLARRALQHYHFWNPVGPIGTGSQWSNETLVAFSCSMFPSQAFVRYCARRLLDVESRQQEASSLTRRLSAVLDGTARPADRSPSLQTIVVLPLRKRGVA